MTIEEINFAPLKHHSFLFHVYVWLKRIRMILVRLIFLALVTLVAIFILSLDINSSYQSKGETSLDSPEFNPIFWLFIWFGLNFILLISMSTAWSKFAKANNFELQKRGIPNPKTVVPSFRGKRMRWSLYPIYGKVNDRSFGFFTRLYKEGGVIRWRERKMDTILWYNLPKYAPHIVVDSRLNEKARRSNLEKNYDKGQLLHFEGSTGNKYFVYTPKGNTTPTLQLFTPDVLEAFYQHLPEVDIEVKDKTIWFVWRYGVLNDKLAADLFRGTDIFMTEFLNQLNKASFTETETMAELV